MTYEGASRVRHGKWSRRSFIQATGAGIAAGAVGGVFPNRVKAAEGLRSIGLGVSEINEIQNKATKDLGFTIAGQAMGYGECLTKLLNQNDQYEIGEWYYHDLALLEPAKAFQPAGSLLVPRCSARIRASTHCSANWTASRMPLDLQ